jgi:SAM-dependent methyltransferase
MANLWTSPVYKLRAVGSGDVVTIDVTTSVSPGLPPHKAIKEHVIPFFRRRDVTSVLDFGAGALRHSFPLLEAGFEVCAVEFEQTFQRPVCAKARKRAERSSRFSSLLWPHQFLDHKRRFDAAFLCYVLQVMPKPKERRRVVRELAERIRGDGFLVYLSRYNQWLPDDRNHRVEDGAYRWPERDEHSFYTEFPTADTHKMFETYGFRHIRSLSGRGTDQFFVYVKGTGAWV